MSSVDYVKERSTIKRKWPLMLWVTLGIIILTGLIAIIAPNSQTAAPKVTRASSIKYELGEKVKANPYGDWLDGKVVGITSEDDYIVHYCGPFGWFNKWQCKDDTLLRSQIAKVAQP